MNNFIEKPAVIFIGAIVLSLALLALLFWIGAHIVKAVLGL